MKVRHFALGILVFSMGLATSSPSQADFQRNAIRRSAQSSSLTSSAVLPGIATVTDSKDLDLSRPMTQDDWAQLSQSLLQAYADQPFIKENLPRLLMQLQNNSEAGSVTNFFFFVGLNVGYVVGIDTNLSFLFGHDPFTGQLAVYPGLITRLQAVSLGTDVHIGAGFLYGNDPTLLWGLSMGGAYVLGAGFGESRSASGAREIWLEIKTGLDVQIGPYVELML